jgi:N-acetylmuramoyl-L-alanine amidase
VIRGVVLLTVVLLLLALLLTHGRPAQGAELCRPQTWPPVARTVVPVGPGDVLAVARVVYGEARGESFCGMAAVAWTIINRYLSGDEYGSTLRQIAHSRAQYAPRRGREGDPAWLTAQMAALSVLTGTVADNTRGATHFLAVWDSRPGWSRRFEQTVRIGQHLFFREAD